MAAERGIVYAKTADNPDPMLGGGNVTVVDDPALTVGAFAENINGLTPGTGYSFVAFARNEGGPGYSPVSTFTTTQTPATAIFGPATGNSGQTLTFTLLASDPTPAMQSGLFTFHIKWGDGTTSVVQRSQRHAHATTHVYANPGVYTIQITATDSHSNVLADRNLHSIRFRELSLGYSTTHSRTMAL